MLRSLLFPESPTGTGLAVLLDIFALSAVLTISIILVSAWKWNSPWLEMLPSFIKDRALGLAFVVNGSKVMDKMYCKLKGSPYRLLFPGTPMVVVSSQHHIKELGQAPPGVLSMHAVAKDILQPRYTTQNFDMAEQRGADDLRFVQAVRKELNIRLPQTLPMLKEAIADEMSQQIANSECKDGVYQVNLFNLANRAVARANCTACFGPELASRPELIQAATRFIVDAFISGEIIRILPKFIALPITRLFTQNHRASKVLFETVCNLIEERRGMEHPSKRNQPVDGLQNIIDTAPPNVAKTNARIAHEAISTFFFPILGLSSTIATSYADLCMHPEYVDPIRQDISDNWADFERQADGFPLLDSFLKESARLNGFEWISGRRRALSPFSFTNGPHVPTGSWVVVPTGSINRDPNYYPDPLRFDGFRFANQDRSRFTDVSSKWLIWGTGRVICPGRFYATLIIKLTLAQLLQSFDCQWHEGELLKTLSWRSSTMPQLSYNIALKSRADAPAPLQQNHQRIERL